MGAMRVDERLAPGGVDAWVTRRTTANWQAFDLQLVFYALALAIVGLLVAWTNSDGQPLAPGSVFSRGIMWLALAIVAFVGASAIDVRWLRATSWLVYVLNMGLLVLTIAIGTGVGDASRWISIFGLQFQFSELAKIVMILALATFFASREAKMGRLSTIIGAGIVMAPPFALVVVQPDLGTALVFGAILAGMLFLSGASLRVLTLGVAAALALAPLLWSVLRDYQQRRLVSFLDPAADPQNSGYQLLQSQLAVGSGGLFGRGLATGSAGDAQHLPVAESDFAAAVLFQGLGFVGGALMLILFVALIWRVLLIGWRSDHLFGVAFAAGIASMLLFQVLVNVGMVIGIMPITGLPLPFISHGGASLISIAIGLGILQSINMRREKPLWSTTPAR